MKKGKKVRKPTKEQRALAEAERKMLARHQAPLELGAKAKGVKIVNTSTREKAPGKLNFIVDQPLTRFEAKAVKPQASPDQWMQKYGGVGSKKESTKYTGRAMLGIGQMHKSNATPIFNEEAAVDIAKMRRG